MNPNAEETKQQMSTVASIPPGNVFPLCSQWALNGRIAYQSGEEKAKKLAKRAVEDFNDKMRRGAENDKIVPEMAVEVSGLPDLEAR